jgi:hypothetical protein
MARNQLGIKMGNIIYQSTRLDEAVRMVLVWGRSGPFWGRGTPLKFDNLAAILRKI